MSTPSRSLLASSAALIVACLTSPVRADNPTEETPAQHYARHSLSIIGSPELSVPATATARILIDGIVRFNFAGGFVVQPRAGIGFGFSTLASGAELIARPGIGIGYAIPVHRSIALTPTVGYDLFIVSSALAGSALFIQRAALDLPVSIVFDSALIEPYVVAGVSIFEGQPDLALSIGLRIGLMLPVGRRLAVHPSPTVPTAPTTQSSAAPAASNEPPSSASSSSSSSPPPATNAP